MATFHQVIALFTVLNRRMARKLIAVKIAIKTMVTANPVPVVTPLSALYTLGQ
jgi:hypothetical protein